LETLTTVPLSTFFELFAPKYLIGTTYTASLAFFESVVLPKIDRSRLQGAVIIGDEFGFANATTEASALVHVTTTYSMVLAPHGNNFHAKVWIMATDDEFAVLCGSGNLTHSGFIGNHELFEVLRIRPGGNQRELGNELIGFVKAIANLFKTFDTDTVPAREILLDCIEAMKGVVAAQGSTESREVYFLSSFGGSFPDQIVARTGASVRKVCVASPFFGGSFKGLNSLSASFPSAKLEVFPALHGSSIDLPLTPAGETRRKLKLWSEKEAFAHLKLYGFSGDADSWLFNGSVNCTDQALSGSNVEAGVLRKVSQSTFAYYFKSDGPLPKVDELKIVWPESGSRWLRIWAANVGSGIRLSLDPAETNTPLGKVSVELLSGSQSTSVQFLEGFVQPVWLIHWERFQKRPEGPNCLSVRITGTDSSGHLREGVAFVDDTAMLSSTPQQRNAWAGVQTILTAEAIPSLAELGAVFELLGRVMEGAEETPAPTSGIAQKSKEEQKPKERAEPIWPPQPGAARGGASGWNLGSDACFRKMLEGLLRDPSLGDVTEEDSADLDDGKKTATPSERRRKAAQKVFELAKERIADFCRRVHSMAPDSVLAERLLPVAVGYFHLAQRVWVGTRKLRPGAARKELLEVVVAYTKALFDRRPQSRSFTPAFNSVYRHSMFPPLAWDIQHRFQKTIHASLVPFHVALFAFLKARGGDAFSRRQWLTFRSAARLGSLGADDKVAAAQVALRLFGEGEQHIEPLKIELAAALNELEGVKWCNEPGYATLLKARQANRNILGVDPNQRFCPNNGCPRITSPEFDGLSAIGTIDCPRCSSVLTSFQLHEAFLLDHGS